ncbi:alpha/beta fold hydrolase [Phenylobacterium aquaticum]|uniref:alpha/beta fold hydrolase n=1 Tax=Phenylobacterium aquaticum TaxID=1763816 RepID=UPI001F5D86A6|nr:alpha/beta fold hydrolase [Phenylobacterium aquaticum]MCI3131994.1 alpha/beta hydrolase [Phenylobacterium aquaticum]
MNRRHMLQIAGGAATALSATPLAAQPARKPRPRPRTPAAAPVRLHVTDWGVGRPIVFLASWALTQDIWQYQHAHFIEAGYRVVAFDRRGHGRSDQPGGGYDIDTLADDLARVLAERNLTEVCLVGHSMGCSEIVRYLGRHGASRVAKIALVSPVTPFLLKTPDNPTGVDGALFEQVRAGWRRDFPKWVADNARPFFRPRPPRPWWTGPAP